jgi:hypothetical protein
MKREKDIAKVRNNKSLASTSTYNHIHKFLELGMNNNSV